MQSLVTAKEISVLLNVSQQRIYELSRRGLIPHIKLGERQYRYSRESVQQWLARGGNCDQPKEEGSLDHKQSRQ